MTKQAFYYTMKKTNKHNYNSIIETNTITEDLYDSLLNNEVDVKIIHTFQETKEIPITFITTEIKPYMVSRFTHVLKTLISYSDFLNHFTTLRKETTEMDPLYKTFFIPKKSGGARRIDAPITQLNHFLKIVKDNLECIVHDAAHAYVKGKSTKTALMKHQENNSNWFLKIDFKDFFSSFNKNRILNGLKNIFPYNIILDDHENYTVDELTFLNTTLTALTTAKKHLIALIEIATLKNGTLPQGTPLSPFLTNILMIPIDYHIQKSLTNIHHKYTIYTRYADDLLFSSIHKFENISHVTSEIQNILNTHGYQFLTINEEKTRLGSSAGSNYNLGIVLNKKNNLSLGYKKKRLLKVKMHKFLHRKDDFAADNPEILTNLRKLQGNLSYFRHFEPEYFEYLNKKYNFKSGEFYLNLWDAICLVIKTTENTEILIDF